MELKKLLSICGELSTCEDKIESVVGDVLNGLDGKQALSISTMR